MSLRHEERQRLQELFTPAELVEALDCDWNDLADTDIFVDYEEELIEILEDY